MMEEEEICSQVDLKACETPTGDSCAPNPGPVPGLLQDTLFWLS